MLKKFRHVLLFKSLRKIHQIKTNLACSKNKKESEAEAPDPKGQGPMDKSFAFPLLNRAMRLLTLHHSRSTLVLSGSRNIDEFRFIFEFVALLETTSVKPSLSVQPRRASSAVVGSPERQGARCYQGGNDGKHVKPEAVLSNSCKNKGGSP